MGFDHTCQAAYTGGVMRGWAGAGCFGEGLDEGEVRRYLDHHDITISEEMYACHPPSVYGCI